MKLVIKFLDNSDMYLFKKEYENFEWIPSLNENVKYQGRYYMVKEVVTDLDDNVIIVKCF